MEAQVHGSAGHVSAAIIDHGNEAVKAALAQMKADGVRYATPDVLHDRHIEILGHAVAGMKLVTGDSGLADGMARAWKDLHGDVTSVETVGAPAGAPTVVLSESCSKMTNAQVAAYRAEAPALAIDIERSMTDYNAYIDELINWVLTNNTCDGAI